MNKPYLLFDAGGTLVFPNQSFLIEEARKHGITLTHKQLFDGYYRTIHNWDCGVYSNPEHPPHNPWPNGYAYTLFETLGMSSPTTNLIAQAFKRKHEDKNLWTHTLPGTKEVLAALSQQGYQMSVLSNSDGRTCDVFRHPQVGLFDFFEHIFDSEIIGYTKPDKCVFEYVLGELKRKPAELIYIGDVFWVDIRGAENAGLQAIHLDPLGLYTDVYWPADRLPSVHHLVEWLAEPDILSSFCYSSLRPRINLHNSGLLVNKNSCTHGDNYANNIKVAALTIS